MRKRNVCFLIRLNEQEYETIKPRIKKTGLSREAYIRYLLLGVVPKEKPDEQFYTVMRELSAIGNNINQLARKAAALGFIDVPFYKREAEKWSAFRMAVKRKFLEPEKLEPLSGSPQSYKLCGEKEQPRSGEPFAADGESDERRVL